MASRCERCWSYAPHDRTVCAFACQWCGQPDPHDRRVCHMHVLNDELPLEQRSRAGKLGGAVKIALRGTGTKTYVKENGRHQHRVVAERMLGRPLRPGEVVHHEDQDKHNNDPSNLLVFVGNGEHNRHHKHLRRGGECSCVFVRINELERRS